MPSIGGKGGEPSAAMDVPNPRTRLRAVDVEVPPAGGLQTEETTLQRARSWSGRRTTLLANLPSVGSLPGPLVSPSFSGRGFIRQSPSAMSGSPGLSPTPLDLRSSLPTIASEGNLAAAANGAADVADRQMTRFASASPSPRVDDVTSAASRPGTLAVSVQDLFGNKNTIRLNVTATISELKQKLQSTTGCPPDAQRLLFNQQMLPEDGSERLSMHGVKDGAVIHLALQDEAAGAARRKTREAQQRQQQHGIRDKQCQILDSLRDQKKKAALDQSLEAPLLLGTEDHQQDSAAEPSAANDSDTAEGNGLLKCVIFGAINAIVAVPCMIAYATIIFADPFFAPYKGAVVKLVLFSSVIHQICFSAKSSLPFAIGQVQDAGLIFLSQMAKSLVASCKAASLADEEIIATTLVGLSCCTAALGAALWLIGRLQLADAVQYLPLPVIGGYLAFIGLYCFEAALHLMTGLEVTGLLSLHDGPTQWHELATLRNLWLTLPGILCGIVLLVVVLRVRHYLALPLSLVAIPVGFYLVLLCTELNLEHLADTNSTWGWIAPLPTETPPPFYEVWKLFDSKWNMDSHVLNHVWMIASNRIYWSALPGLFPTWLGMFFVVAFGSCLDVAAISLDMGQRLDYNHELKTVGISNLVSGILGGYTGSYIFSLTTFTYRSATDSRIVGAILCVAELLLFVLPINIAAYLPHFFFGAVLVFIAIDLLLDWLVHSFHKVSIAEYGIVWCTFLAINFVGLQEGMAIGLAISVVQFALSYARVRKAKPVSMGSNVMRGFHSRTVLAQTQETIAVFQLTGYIFFGSVVQIVADIESHVRVATSAMRNDSPTALDRGEIDVEVDSASLEESAPPTEYVVVDMQAVNGVDATSARSCFLALVQMLRPHGIPLCLSHVTPALERLLRAHDVITDDDPDQCRCFASTSDAVEWCEANILLEQGILSPSLDTNVRPRLKSTAAAAAVEAAYSPRVDATDSITKPSTIAGLQHVLVQFAERAGSSSVPANAIDESSKFVSWVPVASRYFQTEQIASGSTIFCAGDCADCVYVLETGSVTLLTTPSGSASEQKPQQRLLRYSNGGIFGELDFFLGQSRSFDAVASCECTLHVLRRDSYERLIEEEPVAAVSLQSAMLKHLCLEAQTMLKSSVI